MKSYKVNSKYTDNKDCYILLDGIKICDILANDNKDAGISYELLYVQSGGIIIRNLYVLDDYVDTGYFKEY
jgi:hypothetical protein